MYIFMFGEPKLEKFKTWTKLIIFIFSEKNAPQNGIINKFECKNHLDFLRLCINLIQFLVCPKGQLISKPIYDLLTSPKKRTDEFDLFAFLLFTANKSNSSVRFFGESTAHQSAFWNLLTFRLFVRKTKTCSNFNYSLCL